MRSGVVVQISSLFGIYSSGKEKRNTSTSDEVIAFADTIEAL
jgi:hypothetical protein